MATEPKTCPRCNTPHFNFQKCRVRENQKEGLSHWKQSLPDGFQPWNQDLLESVERHGNMIVQKSGLRVKPHHGSIVEKEGP